MSLAYLNEMGVKHHSRKLLIFVGSGEESQGMQ